MIRPCSSRPIGPSLIFRQGRVPPSKDELRNAQIFNPIDSAPQAFAEQFRINAVGKPAVAGGLSGLQEKSNIAHISILPDRSLAAG